MWITIHKNSYIYKLALTGPTHQVFMGVRSSPSYAQDLLPVLSSGITPGREGTRRCSKVWTYLSYIENKYLTCMPVFMSLYLSIYVSL